MNFTHWNVECQQSVALFFYSNQFQLKHRIYFYLSSKWSNQMINSNNSIASTNIPSGSSQRCSLKIFTVDDTIKIAAKFAGRWSATHKAIFENFHVNSTNIFDIGERWQVIVVRLLFKRKAKNVFINKRDGSWKWMGIFNFDYAQRSDLRSAKWLTCNVPAKECSFRLGKPSARRTSA